jgi:hypothetical protein
MSHPRCLLLFSVALFAAGALPAAPAAERELPDVSPAQPVIPERTFNLTDFGAAGDDGATECTKPFRKATTASRSGAAAVIARRISW